MLGSALKETQQQQQHALVFPQKSTRMASHLTWHQCVSDNLQTLSPWLDACLDGLRSLRNPQNNNCFASEPVSGNFCGCKLLVRKSGKTKRRETSFEPLRPLVPDQTSSTRIHNEEELSWSSKRDLKSRTILTGSDFHVLIMFLSLLQKLKSTLWAFGTFFALSQPASLACAGLDIGQLLVMPEDGPPQPGLNPGSNNSG